MKNITELLSTYKSVHMDKKNIAAHFIGVPMILWSISLLLSAIQFQIDFQGEVKTYSILPVCAIILFVYYLLLHPTLCFLSVILLTPVYYSASRFTDCDYFYIYVFGFFFLGWFFQFLGHHYEKAKPAFVDDIRQLFLGPLFLIAEIYFALGFDNELLAEVHQNAQAIRQNIHS
ncbi:MAG: Mpo1-like protein [Thalassotalea sp.]